MQLLVRGPCWRLGWWTAACLVTLGVASSACEDSESDSNDSRLGADCGEGEERCACYGNQTCNPGLTCYSGRCVDTQPDAGEDEQSADEDGPCEIGDERCPCYGNETCNDGLACYSGFCVDPRSASSDSDASDSDDSDSDDSDSDDSDSDDSDSDASDSDDSDSDDSDSDASDSDASDSDDASEGNSASSACYSACESPADCALAVAYYDEDNFECNAGACIYGGCNSDDECLEAGLAVCVEAYAGGVPTCARACEVAADCSLGVPGFQEANHDCVDGGCVYVGCASDDDCSATDTVCVDSGSLRSCVPACGSPADCVTAGSGYVAENFECESGACVYVRCVSDDQCSDQLSGVAAVCR